MVKSDETFAGEFLRISLEQKNRFKNINRDIKELLEDFPLNGRVEVSYTDFMYIRISIYGEVGTDCLMALDDYFGFCGIVYPRESRIMIEYKY